MTTKTVKQEAKLEEFTASFLLSEFRKDVREIERKIDDSIGSLRTEFRNENNLLRSEFRNESKSNFRMISSVQLATMITIIGTILTVILVK